MGQLSNRLSLKPLWRKLNSLLHRSIHQEWQYSHEWRVMNEQLSKAKRVIDMGCGANPHPRASVGVDAFLDPLQRGLGYGPKIDPEDLYSKGVQFVRADLENLPFEDKIFDFAYSHHAFEHLPNPQKACSEMMRIAHAGVIITPSFFTEVAFGRHYHLWFVFARGNTLFFVRKTEREGRPFGEYPIVKKGGGYKTNSRTNPFDILLNYNNWYNGIERMPRLSRLIRKYWYSHSPVMEVVFLWQNSFNCVVILEDGHVL